MTALLLPRPVAAETKRASDAPNAEQCLNAYSEGQRAHKSGAFSKARELLALCGGAACPAALHGDCQRWLSEVEAATPRAVFRVLSPTGDEVADVTLSIDDAPAKGLDGRAIQFDPGEHWLEFRAPGFAPLRRKQPFVEGEKLTSHTVHLEAVSNGASAEPGLSNATTAPTASEQRDAAGRSTLPLWLGVGAAAVGGGGFAYFGLAARRDEQALASCSPSCSNSRVQAVEDKYLVANISLGVGVVGLLGVAAWLVFSPSEPNPDVTSATATGWQLKLDSNTASIYGRF